MISLDMSMVSDVIGCVNGLWYLWICQWFMVSLDMSMVYDIYAN